jgi:hypothetical protein
MKLFEKDGQTYLVVGDKAVPVTIGPDGKPEPVQCTHEIIKHPDGSQDVIVRAPCLQIVGEAVEPDG